MNRKMLFLIIALGMAFGLIFITLSVQAAWTDNNPHRQTACTPGPHSGVLTGDETWCASDSPHFMEGTVTVPTTATLTIEPGTVIEAPGWPWGITLRVLGHVSAMGTPTQPITMTTSSLSTQWGGFMVDGGTAVLRHTTVEYACGDYTYPRHSNVHVINGGYLDMANSLVQVCNFGGGSGEYMIRIEDSRAVISQTTFTASDDYAMYILGQSTVVTMTDNVFAGNANDYIVLAAGAMMGQDTTLTPQTVWDGYYLENTLTVPPTVTLTLEPGVIIKSPGWPWGISLNVQGALRALGTATNPITLTTAAAGIRWGGLMVDGGTAVLDHTIIEHACQDATYARHSNVHVINGGYLDMANSLVRECTFGQGAGEYMLRVEDSQADIRHSTFMKSDLIDIYVNGVSQVNIAHSSIEGGRSRGILVQGDDAWVKVTGSYITGNGLPHGDGVRNEGAATVILGGSPENGNFIDLNGVYGVNQTAVTGQIFAPYNWWGDASGPTHASNPGGTGDTVSDRVIFSPWLTNTQTITAATASLLKAYGPIQVSPGETVNFGLAFNNSLTHTLTNTVIIAHLPMAAEFLSSSAGGQYWPQKHQVIWKLGDVAPGNAATFGVRMRYRWGLAQSAKSWFSGFVIAQNRAHPDFDLSEYLAYQEIRIISSQALTSQELTNTLAADANLNTLFTDSQNQGFVYYGSAQLEQLSDGSDQLTLVMLDPNRAGEQLFVQRTGGESRAIHHAPTAVSVTSAHTAFSYDYQSGDLQIANATPYPRLPFLRPDGSICLTAGCQDYTYLDCLRNCLIRNLNSSQFRPEYSRNCNACYTNGTNCSLCASELMMLHGDAIKNTADMCEQSCYNDNDGWKCDSPSRECTTSHLIQITPCVDCEYDTQNNTWDVCGANTRCINGSCVPIKPKPDEHEVDIVVARDPNALDGPAVITPQQIFTYTISYENVGAGTAYGVYVESQLPDLFDPATLTVNDAGFFYPGSRTLVWDVGQLAGGAGGQVSFQVQVPADAVSGTAVIASAVVHFPSVPETTPTNDVVSLVADVAAYDQKVETTETTAVPITLTGFSPTGAPLTYTVAQPPINGALSGSAPNLIYTPAANVEGLDELAFTVDDGVNVSQPGIVTLIVLSGTDVIPPEVLVASPVPNKSGVKVYETDLGGFGYMPFIWAMFTEPMDAASFTGQSFFVQDSNGQILTGTIEYEGSRHTVSFHPSQPLDRMEVYTATLTTAVTDSSGNPLTQAYTWQFTTESYALYLPVILKP